MNRLTYLLPLLLLLAGPVVAQTIQLNPGHTSLCQAREGGPWYPARPNGTCYAVDENAAPCLAKMEAAMRAMEPFIVNQGAITLDELKILRKAEAQWTAAKQCWRTP